MGTYDLSIERYGYDPYFIRVEQAPADSESFTSSPKAVGTPDGLREIDIPPLADERIEVVPIYTKNSNLTLTLTTDFNAPLSLRSMTWEGDWNPPYYKRV